MLAVAINQLDYQNCAPLHLAAIQGNPQSVYLLINHGADPARKSLGAMTPIHYAAATGNSEAVLALLPHLATNFATQEFNLDGLSARDLALQNSHAAAMGNTIRCHQASSGRSQNSACVEMVGCHTRRLLGGQSTQSIRRPEAAMAMANGQARAKGQGQTRMAEYLVLSDVCR